MAVLPKELFDKIQSSEIYDFIPNIGIIVAEIQELDEYVALLEKKKGRFREYQKPLQHLYDAALFK
jgi:hypothetical protein